MAADDDAQHAGVDVDILGAIPHELDAARIRAVCAAALAEGDGEVATVALLLTDDAGIADLHARYLADPTETDVMSFDHGDGTVDVVVNVARARREAERHGSRFESELSLYIVHGLLHCCGHDDHDADDRRAMRMAEDRVMRRLGLRHAPVDVDRDDGHDVDA